MLKAFLFGLTIGGVGAWLSMQYHLVRTDEGLVIVPRIYQPPVRSAYVDIRHWSPTMWEHYPELSEAIIKSGRNNLLVPGTGGKSASDSAAEQSREPLAALTQQTARDRDVVPSPLSPRSPALHRNIPIADKGAAPGGIPTQLASRNNAAASADLSHRLLTEPVPEMSEGLPSLQRPVPVPVDHAPAQGKVSSARPAVDSLPNEIGSAGVTAPEKQDWMRGFLQSLIPRSDPLRDSETQSPAEMSQEITPARPPQNAAAVTTQEDNWDSFPRSPRRLSNPSLKPL